MTDTTRLPDKKHEFAVISFLFFVALLVRSLALVLCMDVGGDGPTRAIQAYMWSKSPHIVSHGIWLPGLEYLAGSLSLIIKDPLITSRILNLVLGALTIPLFFILVRRIYGHAVALFSASIVIFLPVHIGLSASSLTEASFCFEIITGMLMLILATDGIKFRLLFLSLSLVCLCLASMTRYEFWLLIPLFPSYYFWKTRKLPTATLVLLILSAFPVSWMLGNYLESGDFLLGLTAAKTGTEEMGAHSVDLIGSLKVVAYRAVSHLGWIVSAVVPFGLILQVTQALKRKIDAERLLWLSLIIFFWGFIFYFGMVRGRSLTDRYLLLGFLLALPFAAIPFASYISNNRSRLALLIIVCLVSIGFSKVNYHVPTYVTRKKPIEIKRIASWLRNSPYRDDSVLMTKMGWQSSYLPLYFPEIGSFRERYFIIGSILVSSAMLEDYLKNRKPSLLITNNKDNESISLIENILGRKIRSDYLVHTEGNISIYDMKLMY
jgi:4-amino-4-deoxy-L-arabinose transferase-like glycosyltransferase